MRSSFLLLLGFLISLASAPLNAQTTAEQSENQEAGGEAPEDAVTRHQVTVDGELVSYTARAGTLDIEPEEIDARARIFFTAYTADETDKAERPVTFVFNGGPGASSAYLHLLALGPRIVAMGAEGQIPTPPVRLEDNAHSWIAFTDLVFIDPVGTGFSEALASNGEQEEGGDRRDPSRRFWQIERDLDAIAEFIRLYLSRYERWSSPKFLAGESYGGFRAAALPERLSSGPGVRLNGVVLVSPVLEFTSIQFGDYTLLPWPGVLPSYAATAYHHGKATFGTDDETALSDRLAEVEAFAIGPYLSWLAAGAPLEDEATLGQLTDYVGLPDDLIRRHDGRIPRSVFARRLLEEPRFVSVYDGTVVATDPDPGAPYLGDIDPILDGLTAPLATAFNSYSRDELEFSFDEPYEVLSRRVNRRWAWGNEDRGWSGARGSADSLKDALSVNPDLQVLVVHGAHDLVTPYFTSRLMINQMTLADDLADNVTFEVYPGGHMFYTNPDAKDPFFDHARTFYRDAL